MRAAGIFAAALAVAACDKKPEQTANLVPVAPAVDPTVSLADPDQQSGHVGRAPRRLTVAQLGQSIQVTTGQTWTELARLATTLGQADYALINAESIDPNLVFAKFIEDGAREVCTAATAADLAQASAQNRILANALPDNLSNFATIPDAAIKANFMALSLRFWGQPFGATELARWTTFFTQTVQAATTTAAQSQVLSSVCIAMLTDPRFLTY